MLRLFLVFLFGFLCCLQSLYAQQAALDSLEKLLEQPLPDTTRIDIWFDYTQKGQYAQPDKSLAYAKKAYELAQQLGDKKRFAIACNRCGTTNWGKGNMNIAMMYLQQSLGLAKELKDELLEARNIGNIGLIYSATGNYQQALVYYNKALLLFEKLKIEERIAVLSNNMGNVYISLEQYDQAQAKLLHALPISEKVNPSLLSSIYFNLGNIAFKTKQYEVAKTNLEKALAYAQQYKRESTQSNAYRLLAELDFVQDQQAAGEKKILQAVALAEKLQAKEEMYRGYLTLSAMYASKKDFANAYKYKKLYAIYKDSVQGQATQNSFQIFEYERKYGEVALLKKEKQLQEEENTKQYYFLLSLGLGFLLLLGLSFLFYRNMRLQKQTTQNIKLLGEIGQKITSSLELNEIFEQVYLNVKSLMPADSFGIGVYDAEKNSLRYDLAIENGKRYLPYHRSLDDKNQFGVYCFENKEAFMLNDVAKEYQKYIAENTVLGEKRQLETGEMAKTAQAMLYVPLVANNEAVGIITVHSKIKNTYQPIHLDMLKTIAAYTAVALKNAEIYQETEQNRKEIEIKSEELQQTNEELQQTNNALSGAYQEIKYQNAEITDSINYALRIQTAILPSVEEITASLGKESCFILYKPRNIVSGDFYWFADKGKRKILAVGDCTGHGVAGAFMSMIGNELLNHIVHDSEIYQPAQILSQMHKGLIQALTKSGQNHIADGLDIALIKINTEKQTIRYAGAMNPIYVVENNVLRELKAYKLPIGGHYNNNERNFTEEEFSYIGNGFTTIYLFSDGYQDQFGGSQGKKFMTKQFRNLLQSIHHKKMQDQQHILETTINDWILASNETQTDDMTVVGVRV